MQPLVVKAEGSWVCSQGTTESWGVFEWCG